MRTKIVDPQAVIEAYQSGRGLEDIADEIGVSHSTVYKCLREHGIPRRRRGAPRCAVSDDRIIELRSNGFSLSDIGFVVGMSPCGIYQRLLQAGIRQ